MREPGVRAAIDAEWRAHLEQRERERAPASVAPVATWVIGGAHLFTFLHMGVAAYRLMREPGVRAAIDAEWRAHLEQRERERAPASVAPVATWVIGGAHLFTFLTHGRGMDRC
jgi:hypothetical protein